MDKLAFLNACEQADRRDAGIGTLGEKTLHAVLKNYIEPNGENHEVKIGKYVADIVGENGIYEIQTGNFTKLRPKLEVLLDYTDVTVVYPMAAVKYLSWVDPETGELTKPRRSPKKARPCEAFHELIKIKYTLDNPRFHLKLIMLELHERRTLDGWSKDRKKGSHRVDRIPTGIVSETDIIITSDFDQFIPAGLPEKFTIDDFAKKAEVSYGCAQKTVNALCYLGRLGEAGKLGRRKLFEYRGRDIYR